MFVTLDKITIIPSVFFTKKVGFHMKTLSANIEFKIVIFNLRLCNFYKKFLIQTYGPKIVQG